MSEYLIWLIYCPERDTSATPWGLTGRISVKCISDSLASFFRKKVFHVLTRCGVNAWQHTDTCWNASARTYAGTVSFSNSKFRWSRRRIISLIWNLSSIHYLISTTTCYLVSIVFYFVLLKSTNRLLHFFFVIQPKKSKSGCIYYNTRLFTLSRVTIANESISLVGHCY